MTGMAPRAAAFARAESSLAAAQAGAPMSAGAPRAPRLLIVDDIGDNRAILARRFSRRGFVIAEAESGVRALELIETLEFDAVLLDVMMPDMDGIQVLKRVRARFSSIELPIIMVTAKSQSVDIVEALDLDANDYVTKPVDFAVALARVNLQVSRKWAVEQTHRANKALRDLNERLEERIAERTAQLVAMNNKLAERSNHLVEAQKLGKIGDWSYRLGAADLWWGPETFALLGFDPAAFKTTRDAVVAGYMGDGARRVLDSQAEVLRSGAVQCVDVKYRRCDGSIGDFIVTSKALADAAGNVTGFFGTIQDITDRKRAEEQLEQLAYYDPLTGLANRTLFRREIDEAIKRWNNAGAPSAMLLLDLDGFKEVNDSLGHAAGDELLVQAAHLFSRALGPEHFLARLGGDEFAVIVRDCADRSVAEKLAMDLIDALSGPIKLGYGEVIMGTSIGVVGIGADQSSADELLRCADLALYRAKDDGRGCYRFYAAGMSEVIQKKVALARDLRQALVDNRGLIVHFQPQIEIATGRVAGFEALMRWKHAKHGFIPPSDFIPISERSHLICDLGLWVLRESMRQANLWREAGELPREIAVNVSAAQIWRSDFVSDVARILDEEGLPPGLICLELTESLFVDNARSKVERTLDALKRLGVTLALDDFGTGYSSLGYLAKLPFDKIKIDRVFVDGVGDSEKKQELLRGIIAIGRGLGMALVAEGAEKREEIEMLQKLGCDLVQGYVFARPCLAPEAMAFAHEFESRRCPSSLFLTPRAA
jgi:diguanylate cyclase (GGDEF)-like protein